MTEILSLLDCLLQDSRAGLTHGLFASGEQDFKRVFGDVASVTFRPSSVGVPIGPFRIAQEQTFRQRVYKYTS